MWPPRSSTGTEENAADPANSVALPTGATALWEEKADGLAPWERKVKRAPREEEDDGTDGKVSPASFRVTQWFRLWTTLRRRVGRSEEHTSELQSRLHLVCRLLLEKKKIQYA